MDVFPTKTEKVSLGNYLQSTAHNYLTDENGAEVEHIRYYRFRQGGVASEAVFRLRLKKFGDVRVLLLYVSVLPASATRAHNGDSVH